MATQIGLPPQPGATVEGTARRDTAFAVIWNDLPGGRNPTATDDQILDASVRGVQQEFARNQVVASEAIEVNGFPAREVIVTAPGEGYVFRVVLAETRLYFVAVGPAASGNDANVRRFLDSFRITDPTFLAKRLQRIEDGRRAKEMSERNQEIAREQAALAAKQREKWEAEQRKRQEEAAALAKIEEEKKRTAAEVAAAAFRVAAAVSAPDPTTIPGLKLYLSLNEAEGAIPVWPNGKVDAPAGLRTGPGARGRAIYFAENSAPIAVPPDLLPVGALNGPSTVAAWVKARKLINADVFRVGPGPDAGTPLARLGFEHTDAAKRMVTASVVLPRGFWAPPLPGQKSPNTLPGACPDDDDWHHLALTRAGSGAQGRVTLYIDGEPATVYGLPPGAEPAVDQFRIGTAKLTSRGWGGEKPYPYPDLPLAAVDEVCFFDRALAPDEVAHLAGRAKKVEKAESVRLVAVAKIDPVSGIAFDPDRGVAWATTSVGGFWKAAERKMNQPPTAGHLVRYSYPDFKETGRWAMPPLKDAAGNQQPQAAVSEPVLDVKNNRLFVQLFVPNSNVNHLQHRPERRGTFYRFDLADLPEPDPKAKPPVLTAAASMTPRFYQQNVGGAAVSADGEWLHYFDHTPLGGPGGGAAAVTRVRADLKTNGEELSVPSVGGWDGVWPTPDGKTVRVIQTSTSELLDIEAETWKTGGRRGVFGLNPISADPKVPVAVHPDGRVFAGARAGITETVPGPRAPDRRLRPVVLAPLAFMAISADGRYLVASEADAERNRAFLLDARHTPGRLTELASLEETADVQIGGPPHVSPDGKVVVFRSGQVVRVEDGR